MRQWILWVGLGLFGLSTASIPLALALFPEKAASPKTSPFREAESSRYQILAPPGGAVRNPKTASSDADRENWNERDLEVYLSEKGILIEMERHSVISFLLIDPTTGGRVALTLAGSLKEAPKTVDRTRSEWAGAWSVGPMVLYTTASPVNVEFGRRIRTALEYLRQG